MFNNTFYPSTPEVIDQLIEGLELRGKKAMDPQGGSGKIVDRLITEGAEVISCELDADLRKILQTKCVIIGDDFLKVTSDQVSHLDCIVMNPPFYNAHEHILHAWKIAPAGCKIRSLCNIQTLENAYSKSREEFKTIVDTYGNYSDIGAAFAKAERKTDVKVGLVRLEKPGANYNSEFEGFFMDEDPHEEQANGLMSYNAVRDLVNRYVESIKIFDEQLNTAVKLGAMQKDYFDTEPSDEDERKYRGIGHISVTINSNGVPLARNEFKKRMQKSGWQWIFSKLKMEKHTTQGLREDINKFVESQMSIPFTMKNIYRMLEIVIATTSSRMDKVILEAFDKVTSHSHDNRHNITGWKTNSHYLLTKRFISPNYKKEEVEDLVKALCFLTGDNYDNHETLYEYLQYANFLVDADGKFINNPEYEHAVKYKFHDYELKNGPPENLLKKYPGSKIVRFEMQWGKWFDWGFFKVRKYKKGTVHYEFKDENVWARFNQHVAKLKGYPLPEKRSETAYQARQNGHKQTKTAYKPTAQKPVVLSTIQL